MTSAETSNVPQQERVAGALGSILFFIPILMERKTEFTVFFMKQSFLLLVVNVVISIVTNFVWFIHPLTQIIELIVSVIAIFLAWNAYQGKKLVVPGLLEYSDKLITALKVQSWFTPGK